MYRKIIIYVGLLLPFIPTAVALADGDDGSITSPIKTKEDIYNLAVTLSQWFYRIFFVVAVFYILLAAYTYLTARDDAGQVKKATASLKHAVIAIVIALVSTGLSLLVKDVLKP